MNRSIIIAVLCIAVVAGAIVYTVYRPKSTATLERESASWRVCSECGHQWTMDLAEIKADWQRNPEKNGCVQCPECKAWRGMPRMHCPKCDKYYPAFTLVGESGGSRRVKQRKCSHCGYELGSDEMTQEPAGDGGAPE